MEIKIGKSDYEIKPGDYIRQNNAKSFSFCAGDGRTIKNEVKRGHAWRLSSSVDIPKKTVKKLCIHLMPVTVSYYLKMYKFTPDHIAFLEELHGEKI